MKRVAVVEDLQFGEAAREGVVDRIARQRRSERQVPAGEAFAESQEVRLDPVVLTGEHRARAAEAGRDLVGEEEHVVVAAKAARRLPGSPAAS